jgi:hypothetical protein
MWLRLEPQKCALFKSGHRAAREEQPSSKKEISTEFKKATEVEGDLKRVALDPRVPDKAVCIDTEMSMQEQVELM